MQDVLANRITKFKLGALKFLQNEGLPRTKGFCKHPFSPSSLTCVQNKVPAVSKFCVSCRSTNLLAE